MTFSIPGFAEPASSFTHLLGAGVAAVAGVFLLWRGRGNRLRVGALAVFVFGVVLLLAVSGTYHSIDPVSGERIVMRHLDHAAIWILIASTFTPLHILLLRGGWRWGMLAAIWGGAIAGICLELFFLESIPHWLIVLCFLVLGWMGAISAWHIKRVRGGAAIAGVIRGGIAYSVGAAIEALGAPTLIPGVVGPHELFHVAVLIGVTYHFRLVWQWAREDVHAPLPALPARAPKAVLAPARATLG